MEGKGVAMEHSYEEVQSGCSEPVEAQNQTRTQQEAKSSTRAIQDRLERSPNTKVNVTLVIQSVALAVLLGLVIFAHMEISQLRQQHNDAIEAGISFSELKKTVDSVTNEMVQSKNEAKNASTELEQKLIQYQSKSEEALQKSIEKIATLEYSLLQYRNKSEEALQNANEKIVQLEYSLKSAEKREKQRLVADGFQSLSNGLLFKFFNIRVSYENAKTRCRNLGTTLAVESIRNETLRSELNAKLKPYYAWIGLEESMEVEAWVWSDGKIFEYNDAPGENITHTTDGFTYAAALGDNRFYRIKITELYRYVCERNF